MTSIRWTESARADLRVIHAFIAKDSRVYAQRMIDRIKKAVERLETISGVGNYRVIYSLEERKVVILTVIHAASQLSDDPTDL